MSLPSAGALGILHYPVSLLPPRVPQLTELAEDLSTERLREHWRQFCSSPTRKWGLQKHNLPQGLQPAPCTSPLQEAGLWALQPPGSPALPPRVLGWSEAQAGTRCHRDVLELLPGADPMLPSRALHSETPHGSLEPATVQVFTPQKRADATTQGSAIQGATVKPLHSTGCAP